MSDRVRRAHRSRTRFRLRGLLTAQPHTSPQSRSPPIVLAPNPVAQAGQLARVVPVIGFFARNPAGESAWHRLIARGWPASSLTEQRRVPWRLSTRSGAAHSTVIVFYTTLVDMAEPVHL
jgi:hypothetical protein